VHRLQIVGKPETAMPDPLLCDYPLPLHRRFYPLGFPLDVFTNSELVLEAGHENWGQFTQTYDRPPAVLRIGITESGGHRTVNAPACRGNRNLISIISDAENFSICDLRKGFAFAWLTSDLMRDAVFARYFFLEASAYLLIASANLVPIHAACVEWQGRGVLLTGEAATGKSSLAYACARSGWTYISDDASYLVRDGDPFMITGNPFCFRLRDDASSLFPEFEGTAASFRANGTLKIEVPTCRLSNLKTSSQSRVYAALFLNRTGRDSPTLVRFPKDEALRRWSESICYGDEEMRAQQNKALMSLLAIDIYELQYAEASDAVSYLEMFLAGEMPCVTS
jgi:hypothetical protein